MVFLLSLLVQVLVHPLLLAPGFRAILSFILIAKLILALQSEGPQVPGVQQPPQEPVSLELLILWLKTLGLRVLGLKQPLPKLARPLAFQLRALLLPYGIQELLGLPVLPLFLQLLGLQAILLPFPLAVRQSMVPMAQGLLLQSAKSAPPALSHPHQ